MENQLATMKMFSSNPRLVQLLERALELKKAATFKIGDVKVAGRLFGFQIESNMQLKELSFSYLLFSGVALSDQHNSILGDFTLVDGQKHMI